MNKNCRVCNALYVDKNWRRNGDNRGYCSRPCKYAIAPRFWERVKVADGCWEWQARLDENGYGRFSVDGSGLRAASNFCAHRMSYLLTFGFFDEELDVLHRCDNPPCVNPDHLFLGTHTDNMRDMFAKGRRISAQGSRVGTAKLTEDQVVAILNQHRQGRTGVSLAREYQVSTSMVSHIVRRQAWRHVSLATPSVSVTQECADLDLLGGNLRRLLAAGG